MPRGNPNVIVSVSMPPGLLERIDAACGSKSRSTWIAQAVEQALGIGDMGTTAVSQGTPSRATASRRASGGPERTPTISVSPDLVPAPAEPLTPIEAERRRREMIQRAYRPPKK